MSEHHYPPPAPPVPSPPPTRLSPGGVLNRSVGIFRAHPVAYMLLVLVTAVPLAILSTGATVMWGTPTETNEVLGRSLVEIFVQLLISPLSAAATAVCVLRATATGTTDASFSLGVVADRVGMLFPVLAVYALGITAGFVLFVIPAVLLSVIWLFVPIAVAVEGASGSAAFRRSGDLVRGVFWWTLACILLVGLVAGLLLLLFSAGGQAMAESLLNGHAATVTAGIWTLVGTVLLAPLVYISATVMYIERLRLTGEVLRVPSIEAASDS